MPFEGLQLIAQFNFQRAGGVLTPQKSLNLPQIHPFGGQKFPSADSHATRHLRYLCVNCEAKLSDSIRLSTNYLSNYSSLTNYFSPPAKYRPSSSSFAATRSVPHKSASARPSWRPEIQKWHSEQIQSAIPSLLKRIFTWCPGLRPWLLWRHGT